MPVLSESHKSLNRKLEIEVGKLYKIRRTIYPYKKTNQKQVIIREGHHVLFVTKLLPACSQDLDVCFEAFYTLPDGRPTTIVCNFQETEIATYFEYATKERQ